MASSSVTVTVRVQPWVPDFLQVFARCGLGKAGQAAIGAFIAKRGLRFER